MPRRLRSRLLDLLVATSCVACVAAPALTIVNAAAPKSPVIESGGTVDQKVVEVGIISHPLNGSFGAGKSGVVNGSVQWDLYSTSTNGMKLLLSTDRAPAMRDAANGVDVPDAGSETAPWNVGSGQRAFGFTALGDLTLNRYADGAKWRGLDGKRSVELGRRAGAPIGRTRTTVRLRAEFAQQLAANARPTSNLRATAVLNL
ncbi:MAG: hypothetical protein JWO69_1343 [Thermoleophilia bacterium]|jgi:hypothetical protein|nr:hypothetical protein [Thermoleophilia bacterium]